MRKMHALIKMLEDNGIEVLRAQWIDGTLEIDTSDDEKAKQIMRDDGYEEE